MNELAPFDLTHLQKQYLDSTMNKVSRSFALVTPCLEAPLADFMSTAYLICRVVDNIEDCQQPFAWQRQRFAEFVQLLQEPARAGAILSHWQRQTWPGLNEDERQLMGLESGAPLWQIYATMPAAPRLTVGRWARAMAEGMQSVKDPAQAPRFSRRRGVDMAAGAADYDRYCYFVAGTVGHMATELAIDHYGFSGEVSERLLANSEACGRALQKTNIVKDFARDLARGVSYLPESWLVEAAYEPLALAGAPAAWKRMVLDDVLGELQDAVTYVLDLPYAARGYRLASLLCLLPAYQTILLAAERQQLLFTVDHHVKISRATLSQCLQDAQALLADNEAIGRYSQAVLGQVDRAFNASTITVGP